MAVSGVVSRQVPCLSGAVNDAHYSKASLSVPPRVVFSVTAGSHLSGGKLRIGLGCSRSSSSRHRRAYGFSNSGFADHGHLDYYRGKPRCGGKEKSLGAMTTKKKLKLLKGLLSEDLSMFSEMGSGFGGVETQSGLVGEVQGKLISEAAEVLIKQLQHVRAEEKEMKKKKKMEKAKLKASMMKESSSSSSSSSSESECGEVMDMSSLRRETLEQPIIDVTQNQASATLIVSGPSSQIGNNVTEGSGSEDRSALVTQEKYSSVKCSSSNAIPVSATGSVLTKSIEVCMGKKCTKSGAEALLDEFERVLGIEGAVVGCKCMGKCKDGPNVRILSPVDETQSEMVDDSVRTPSNPLCIKVGLEDVDLIVAKFLGEDRKDLDVAPAS